MGVSISGLTYEEDGHAETMRHTIQAHIANSDALINITEDLAAGRKVNKSRVRPPYNPAHADNQWPATPILVYHAEKGHKTIGKSAAGMEVGKDRAAVTKQNEADLETAKKEGWRLEPYAVPQVAVLDPAAEKAELLRKLAEKDGQITALADQQAKMAAKLDALLAKVS